MPPEVLNRVYPIVGVWTYPGGVMVVKRECKLQKSYAGESGRKGREIVRFTEKSMSRLVATVNATKVRFSSMITLTYPHAFPKDGRAVKEDLNRFLNIFRRVYASEYLWFLEFQKRGAPHFHVLLQYDAITPRMRLAVAENWVTGIAHSQWFAEWAEKRSLIMDCKCVWDVMRNEIAKSLIFTMRPETWQLLRDADAAAKYTTKYACKEYQKEKPAGFEGVGRFWGCSQDSKLKEGQYFETDEKKLRAFLENQGHLTSDWTVLPKYLFNVQSI